MGLRPMLNNFFCNHSGEVEFCISLKYRLTTNEQLFPSFWIDQVIGLSNSSLVAFFIFIGLSLPIPLADKSLAIPLTLKQSPRLGVTPISKIGSFKFNAVTASVPFGRLPWTSIIPSWLSLRFNSLSDKSIPSDTSPRILPFFKVISVPGIYIPSAANIPFIPFFTLGAPQITWNVFSPFSTEQIFNRSALGCFLKSTIVATTNWA